MMFQVFFLELTEHCNGFLAQFCRDKDVVMPGTGHNVATDPGSTKRLGKCGGKANRLQIRLNRKNYPSCPEYNGQAKGNGIGFQQYRRHSFWFAYHGKDFDVPQKLLIFSRNKHIDSRLENRLHGGKQHVKIGNGSIHYGRG